MEVLTADVTNLVENTENFVKKELEEYDTAHDFYHVDRVRRMALYLAKGYNADVCVVEVAALLHDVADYKYSGDEKAGGNAARKFLSSQGCDHSFTEKVAKIVEFIGFKNSLDSSLVDPIMETVEFAIVRDADRLDAMGAFGIARCHITASKRGNPIHDPSIRPKVGMTKEEYVKETKSTALNHFYEKLLFLKDQMMTERAKPIAAVRHAQLLEHVKNLQDDYDLMF